MRTLIARPLSPEVFKAYGDVLDAPTSFGRVYTETSLANGRAAAQPSLSFSLAKPIERLPLQAVQMERHEFSSQSFVPMDPGRWLVVVAPKLESGMPDVEKSEAFVAGSGQGVTYGMNVWHHPLSVIDLSTGPPNAVRQSSSAGRRQRRTASRRPRAARRSGRPS